MKAKNESVVSLYLQERYIRETKERRVDQQCWRNTTSTTRVDYVLY